MTNERAKEVAAKLTKAGKHAIRFDGFPDYAAKSRTHRIYAALERQGLLLFRHIIAGQGDFHLTPLGLEVRRILQEQEHAQ